MGRQQQRKIRRVWKGEVKEGREQKSREGGKG